MYNEKVVESNEVINYSDFNYLGESWVTYEGTF